MNIYRGWTPDMKRRNGMHRILLASIVVALVICSLVLAGGCGDRKQAGTTIRFVTWKPNQPEIWEEILELFHREYPGVRVEREIGPHSSTAFHDLLTQKLKNQSTDVDVFFMDVIWPAEFAAAGWARPLDEFLPPEERGQFLEGSLLADTYQGMLYGIPLFIDAGVLYYRTDLLDAYGYGPPKTWPEMVSIAATIVQGESRKGQTLYGFSGQFKQYEGLVCNMMEYILSNGGAIIDPLTKTSALGRKPAREAVSFVRDHIIGKSAPVGVLTYQEPESLDLFVQGKAVFLRSWPYAWEISNNREKSTIAGKVGIAKLPYFPGGRSYSTLGGWHLGISSFSKQPEAAWKFVEFLTSERVQKLLAVKSGKAPTRRKLYEDGDVLKANPHFKDMKDVFLAAYPRPRTPLYPAVSHILQRYFSTAIAGPAKTDIEKAAAEASRDIDRVLSLAQ